MKEKGSFTLFNLIIVLLLAYGGYVAFVYGKIEIDKKAFTSAVMDTVGGMGHVPLPELKRRIIKLAERKHIDIDEDSIYITKTKENIHVELTYYVYKNLLLWKIDRAIDIVVDAPAATL